MTDGMTPEPCPACVAGPAQHQVRPHVHLTGYGYVIWVPPENRVLTFIEEVRRIAYREGRDDEAAGAPVPAWVSDGRTR